MAAVYQPSGLKPSGGELITINANIQRPPPIPKILLYSAALSYSEGYVAWFCPDLVLSIVEMVFEFIRCRGLEINISCPGYKETKNAGLYS
jgi:hypothetical protein